MALADSILTDGCQACLCSLSELHAYDTTFGCDLLNCRRGCCPSVFVVNKGFLNCDHVFPNPSNTFPLIVFEFAPFPQDRPNHFLTMHTISNLYACLLHEKHKQPCTIHETNRSSVWGWTFYSWSDSISETSSMLGFITSRDPIVVRSVHNILGHESVGEAYDTFVQDPIHMWSIGYIKVWRAWYMNVPFPQRYTLHPIWETNIGAKFR
jgi:hypothetical protein